ncbi:hypothetical protein J6590_007164 [Homalodisca vitripennis]|nr:hypothetical protein J6590_007164 [Homalodisca vitripennis]
MARPVLRSDLHEFKKLTLPSKAETLVDDDHNPAWQHDRKNYEYAMLRGGLLASRCLFITKQITLIQSAQPHDCDNTRYNHTMKWRHYLQQQLLLLPGAFGSFSNMISRGCNSA